MTDASASANADSRVGFDSPAIRRLALMALVVWAGLPVPVDAQSVSLRFDNGHVTLIARDAPIRSVLAEWAAVGGATVVNAERVVGGPVTLELSDVPEAQALAILLRGVSGYLLASREPESVGASAFDRILILPTSTAPRNPPPVTPARVAPRPVAPEPRIVPEGEGDADAPVGDLQEDPTPTRRLGIPRPVPPQPFDASVQEPAEQADEVPAAEGTGPTPNNPFGVPFGTTSRPGIVTPVPQPNPNGREGQGP